MNVYFYALIIWFLAAFLAISSFAAEPYQYTPMCMQTKAPKVHNWVRLVTGPSTLKTPEGRNETLIGIGYTRRIKDDLGVGVLFLGTDSRFLGGAVDVQIGF